MYSEFWSTIIIDGRHPYPHSTATWGEAVSVAKVFLERNEGRPFSFSINTKHPCLSILDLFIAESTRWKNVSLYLDDDDENIPLFQSIRNKIPQLRSLAVNTRLEMSRDFPSIFEDAPALTHLSLIHLENWHMDWSLLTELELGREFNLGRLLRVLSKATNLERLGINRLTFTPMELSMESFEPVALPRLRSLEISTFVILQFLTTPALQELYIRTSYPTRSIKESCASFFTRSSCQLQRFGTLKFCSEDFGKLLHYMPDLKVLSVCNPVITPMDEFIEAMTCRTGGQSLVPQLRVLRLSNKIWGKVNNFKNMLESRASDRFLHSVQELKVIAVTETYWNYTDTREFKHPNFESRFVEKSDFSHMSAKIQWLCDDLDC